MSLERDPRRGEGRAAAALTHGHPDGYAPSGVMVLAVGLHAAATAESFSEAIEVASNHDGDSDSTASIAGQLYGAKHGLAALPELHMEWERRGGSRT